jgi:outer membrane protein assembly factor BamB
LLVNYKFRFRKDLEKILYFISFNKHRILGILLGNIGIQEEMLTKSDLERGLITQRAIFRKKKKIVPLMDILKIKKKITPENIEKLEKRWEIISSGEHYIIYKKALDYFIQEDKKDNEWRLNLTKRIQAKRQKDGWGTTTLGKFFNVALKLDGKQEIPPSKYEKEAITAPYQQEILPSKYEKEAVTSPYQQDTSSSKETQQKENSSAFAPPTVNKEQESQNQQISNFISVRNIASNHEDLELNATIAMTLDSYSMATTKKTSLFIPFTIAVCILALAVGLIIVSDNKEIKDFQNINYLIENKEYENAEESCHNFLTIYPRSKQKSIVLHALQELILQKADIQYKMQSQQEAKKYLHEVIQLDPESELAHKSRNWLKQIEQECIQQKQQQKWEERFIQYSSHLQNNQYIAAKDDLAWLTQNNIDSTTQKKLNNKQEHFQKIEKEYNSQLYKFIPRKEWQGTEINLSSKISFLPKDISVIQLQAMHQQYNYVHSLGYFYTIANGFLYCLQASNGKTIWLDYIGEKTYPPLFLLETQEFYNTKFASHILVASSHSNSITVYEAQSGKIAWKTELPSVIAYAPVIHKNKVYVTCLDNFCYTIDLQTHQWDGGYKIPHQPNSSPTFDKHENIMYQTTPHHIYAYSIQNGKLLFTIPTKDSTVNSVVSLGNYVLVPTQRQVSTTIACYQIKNKQNEYIATEIKTETFPDKLQSPLILTNGLLAFTTNNYLYIYSIHPSDSKETFLQLVRAKISLPDTQQSTFLEFTNFTKYLLIAQQNFLLFRTDNFKSIQLTTETKKSIPLETYLPIQHTENYYFFAQRTPDKQQYYMKCFELKNNQFIPIWEKTISQGIQKDPILTKDHRVFFFSQDGNIHELYVHENQKLNYRLFTDTNADAKISPCYLSMGDGYLYIAQNNQQIVCYNSITGLPSRNTILLPLSSEQPYFTIHKENIFFTQNNAIFGYSLKTGKKNHVELEGPFNIPFTTAIVSYGDFLYVGNKNGQLYEIKSTPERPLPYLQRNWGLEKNSAITEPIHIQDNILFLGTENNHVYALDLVTKIEYWNKTIQGNLKSRPIVFQGITYFGTDERMLYAIENKTGKILWSKHCYGKILTSPVIANNKLYFATMASELYCCDPLSGVIEKQYYLGSPIASNPVVLENYLLLAGTKGFLYIVDIQKH